MSAAKVRKTRALSLQHRSRSNYTYAGAALLWSLCAWAQGVPVEYEGLDLSDGEKPAEASPEDIAATKPHSLLKDETGTAGEVVNPRFVREDRVKSVQRKLYLKRHRFELAPYVSFAVNDPYYVKFGVSGRLAFYLTDTLAIAGRFSLVQTLPSDDVRVAKRSFQAKIFYSSPRWWTVGDFEWSPLYGKVSFLNSILHFDAYLLAGGGVVYTETSTIPGRGVLPAADLGIGIRFVAKDFLSVNVALTNTAYVDTPVGTNKAALQNAMMLHAGVSLFLPFRSTTREAE